MGLRSSYFEKTWGTHKGSYKAHERVDVGENTLAIYADRGNVRLPAHVLTLKLAELGCQRSALCNGFCDGGA